MPPNILEMAAAPLRGYSLTLIIFSIYGWSSIVICPAAMAPITKQTGGRSEVGSGGIRAVASPFGE
jgi:hypothetical protein